MWLVLLSSHGCTWNTRVYEFVGVKSISLRPTYVMYPALHFFFRSITFSVIRARVILPCIFIACSHSVLQAVTYVHHCLSYRILVSVLWMLPLRPFLYAHHAETCSHDIHFLLFFFKLKLKNEENKINQPCSIETRCHDNEKQKPIKRIESTAHWWKLFSIHFTVKKIK